MPTPSTPPSDYELLWPRELFIRELTALQAIQPADERTPQVERLLEEAFLGDTPVLDYKSFDTGDYVAELLVPACSCASTTPRAHTGRPGMAQERTAPAAARTNCASTSRG